MIFSQSIPLALEGLGMLIFELLILRNAQSSVPL